PFFPAWLTERKGIRLRFGRAFLAELLEWRPGCADMPSIYEAVRILSPAPDEGTLARVRALLPTLIPAFASMKVAQSWAGMIDTTPDAIPAIGAVPGIPGCIVGTGFSGHGFGIGPGAGRVLAELATGRSLSADITGLGPERFADGRKLTLQKWL